MSMVSYIIFMRVILHPSIDDITLEALFYALGNDARLRIVANLANAGKKPLICAESVEGIEDLSQSTTSHHFRVLREGGLVYSERKGKECLNTLRTAELEAKFPGVMKSILAAIKAKGY